MKRFLLILLLIETATGLTAQEAKDTINADVLVQTRQYAEQYYPRLNELIKSRQLTDFRTAGSHVLFGWPLRTNASYDDTPNYYTIDNYVDNDNIDDSLARIEYNCGYRTYNGHNGTDISLWPFWWNMMNNEYVQAVAAAPGIVIVASDNNNNDFNCSCTGTNNYISVLHADSSVSSYVHIKTGSARVSGGDIVEQGQPLADIASSGCSSNPHLHFEIRDKNNAVIDPWVGTNPATDCNNRNEGTYWQNQKPYWEPQINRIMTHGSQPSITNCFSGEFVQAKNNFAPGNTVYLGIAMHDYINNTSVSYILFFPNGTVAATGSHSNTTGSNSSAWYLVFSIPLTNIVPVGTYQVAATYQGITRWHYFTVNCISDYNLSGTLAGARGYIASNSIVSTATLPDGSKIRMQAANVITFNPGFTAVAGTTLKARIRDCNYSE